jgi:hypothetical protein
MAGEDVLEILARLDDAGIEWWLDGGWGGVSTRCSAGKRVRTTISTSPSY